MTTTQSKKRKNSESDSVPAKKAYEEVLMHVPTVVHLRRSKGEIMQNCDTYIGRACNMGGWRLKQSKWYNPYSIRKYKRDDALERYESYLRSNRKLFEELHELSGKTLGCWCKPERCHGDVLCKLFEEKFFKSASRD